MTSTEQRPWQSIDVDFKDQNELCPKVTKTTSVAAIEDPFVPKALITPCQGNGDHSVGEITALNAMCDYASQASRPRTSATSATPVTPGRIAIPSDDMLAIRARMPPTPDQTPSRGIKRSFSAALAEGLPSSETRKLFRSESERSPAISLFRRDSIPKFSILHKPQACRSPVVSAVELKRISEAVLEQVDWEAVEEEVASNRGAAMYRKVIKSILQARIDQLADLETKD